MEFKLSASLKKKEEKNSDLRTASLIPAVLYGLGFESIQLTVKAIELDKINLSAGESKIINLTIEGQKELVEVLIKEIQKHPKTGKIIHVDFFRVTHGKKIKAKMPLIYSGESTAVTQKGGILAKNLEFIQVKCMAENLIQEIEVDVSHIKDVGKSIKIKDLKIPDGVSVLHDANEPVVSVISSRASKKEAEVKGAPAAAAAAPKAKAKAKAKK